MARRPGVATPLMLLVLCVALLAGCAKGPVEFTAGEGPLLRDRATPIGGVSIEVGGNELVIEFIGGPEGDVLQNPCNTEYVLEVSDQLKPGEFTIWQLKPTVRPEPIGLGDTLYVCNAVGYRREFRHPITGTMPTEIIDGSNDAIVPVIALTQLLSPSVLPNGWEIHETGAPPEPESRTTAFSDGTSIVFLRTTLEPDPESALDRFRSGTPEPQPQPGALQGDPLTPTLIPLSPLPFDGTVQEIAIRNGTAALAETANSGRRLRFVHGSYLYEFSAGLEVPDSVLTAIAEGLQ